MIADLQKLTEVKLSIDNEISALRQKHNGEAIFSSKNQWKLEGVTSVQLRSLIDYFTNNPDADTTEKFEEIFGRKDSDGKGILAELEKCYVFVQKILGEGDVLSRMNVSRFMGPDEVLAQTHSSSDQGFFDYNEIGLDLRPESGFKPDMIKVKGILIDSRLIQNSNLSQEEKNQLSQLIKTAKEYGLPIFYKN